MHDIYELKEMLMKELEEYGRKGELKDVGSLEIIDKLAHTIKNLCKIIEAAEEEEGGGSSYYMGGSSRYAGRESGQSRARRRDSMGRYSRDGRSRYGGGSSRYEGGSSRYDGGSSYAEDEMVETLKGMMGELPQEVQRDAQKLIQKLEQM